MEKQSARCRDKNSEHSDKPGNMNTEYDEPINLRRTWASQYGQNTRYLPREVSFADSVTCPHTQNQ